MREGRWLLYGANGYSGELIAEAAKRRGEQPILAGRRAEAVKPLAERLGFEHRVFALDDQRALDAALAEVAAVCLAAGPFSHTSRAVVDGCLRTGCHYTDITGEIAVFEACLRRDAEARERGSVVLPGVGFDVVPSDCLAKSLAEALPEATALDLAFASEGGMSQGTAKTVVEGLPLGGAVRRGGRLTKVPAGWRREVIRFHDRERLCVTIPWGDVSTAYRSTKIPDIAVLTAAPKAMRQAMAIARVARPLLGLGFVQRLLARAVERFVTPPTAAERAAGKTELWGRVTAPGGKSVEGTLTTMEGYTLTAITALDATMRVARGEVEPGAWTPSLAFGAGYIATFEGCTLRVGAGGGGGGAGTDSSTGAAATAGPAAKSSTAARAAEAPVVVAAGAGAGAAAAS